MTGPFRKGWGNWVAAAGLTGGRVNRFNIIKQSKDYDLKGEYVRHWIPELAKLPADKVHEPWKLSSAEQEEYGVRLGSDYPLPPKLNTHRGPTPRAERGEQVPRTPSQARALDGGGRGGKGKGGGDRRGRGGRGDRKRVQHDF